MTNESSPNTPSGPNSPTEAKGNGLVSFVFAKLIPRILFAPVLASPLAAFVHFYYDFEFWSALAVTSVGVFVFLVFLFLFDRWKRSTGELYPCRAEPATTAAPTTPRNHIICLDGTNNGPSLATNVFLLFGMLEADSELQIARYYWGIGNQDTSWMKSKYMRKWMNWSPFGASLAVGPEGLKEILDRAYFDFLAAYKPGDRVFIFGFSRGAATARVLANRICRTPGIPKSVEINCLKDESSKLFTIENGKEVKKDVVTSLRTEGDSGPGACGVEFLGLWDTVTSAGLPTNKIDFFDWSVPPGVRKVCHLVSLDEKRSTFDVVLIDQESGADVEEIWFPGNHANVGGGHSNNDLSGIALRFMAVRAEKHGIRFKFPVSTLPPIDLAKLMAEIDETAICLPDWKWRFLRKRKRIVRQLTNKPNAKPVVHKSAFILKELGKAWYPGENTPDRQNCTVCEAD